MRSGACPQTPDNNFPTRPGVREARPPGLVYRRCPICGAGWVVELDPQTVGCTRSPASRGGDCPLVIPLTVRGATLKRKHIRQLLQKRVTDVIDGFSRPHITGTYSGRLYLLPNGRLRVLKEPPEPRRKRIW